MKLDILIPVYEPIDGWAEDLIVQYQNLLSHLPEGLKSSLIIVNDGSKKNLDMERSYITSKFPNTQWISYVENKGKGYALREAAKRSKGKYILYTDCDFPYTYGSMVSMLEKLMSSKSEVVIGRRDDSYYEYIPQRRRRISVILKKVNRMLFNFPTDDTQCGLKAFVAKHKKLFLDTKSDRYLIDVEFLRKLVRNKANISIETVELRKGVVLSNISNISLFKEAINYLRIMLG